MTKKRVALVVLCGVLYFGFPTIGYATVQSSLEAIQSELVGRLLPVAAVLGLLFAAFSFVMGHPNARGHLILAIIGACIGFGAQSIVALIRQLVR